MNISLPASLRRYVEERVAEGGYGDTSEYVRDLIRRERDARTMTGPEWLDAQLLAGLDSGQAVVATPEWFIERRNRLVAEFKPAESGTMAK